MPRHQAQKEFPYTRGRLWCSPRSQRPGRKVCRPWVL